MYQDLTPIKVIATQEKGYTLPSGDDLDETKVTVSVNGETKVYNIDEIEPDNDDDSLPISDTDAMNFAQALVNEQRAKRNKII